MRGENVVCGTSSTGTGALTLSATPAPPGGVNFDAYLKGVGFASGDVVPISYVINEYTDSTFASLSKFEKGLGTVTLGASIAAATLTRTAPQVVWNGTTYSDHAPSAYSIGTAANVLVMMSPSAVDLVAMNPYFDTGLGDNVGSCPLMVGQKTQGGAQLNAEPSGSNWYCTFVMLKSLWVRRVTLRVATAYTGASPVSSASASIYKIGANGRPGRLLCDYGALGGANPLNTVGNISSALSAGILLTPDEYFLCLYATFTGGSAGPSMTENQFPLVMGTMGLNSLLPSKQITTATGGSATAPTTANVTGYAYCGSGGQSFVVALNNA